MGKPWAGEFPVDDPSEMDDQAIEILVRNMRLGRARTEHTCRSELTTSGHGAYCVTCGETLA